jgi:hypothetical protein
MVARRQYIKVNWGSTGNELYKGSTNACAAVALESLKVAGESDEA